MLVVCFVGNNHEKLNTRKLQELTLGKGKETKLLVNLLQNKVKMLEL